MNLSAIGISCESIERTIEFYEFFGLKFQKLGEDHYEATAENGLRIMLDSYELMKKINPSWEKPNNPGVTLCFEQNSPEDVDTIYQKIIDAGYKSEKEPWDAFWGQRYASVKDPSGNQIDIFAAMEPIS